MRRRAWKVYEGPDQRVKLISPTGICYSIRYNGSHPGVFDAPFPEGSPRSLYKRAVKVASKASIEFKIANWPEEKLIDYAGRMLKIYSICGPYSNSEELSRRHASTVAPGGFLAGQSPMMLEKHDAIHLSIRYVREIQMAKRAANKYPRVSGSPAPLTWFGGLA
jgi:hypothetical protein